MTKTYRTTGIILFIPSEGRIEERPLLWQAAYRAPPQRCHPYRTDVKNLDPTRPVKEGLYEPTFQEAHAGLTGCCVGAWTALADDPHVATMMEMRNRSDMPTA